MGVIILIIAVVIIYNLFFSGGSSSKGSSSNSSSRPYTPPSSYTPPSTYRPPSIKPVVKSESTPSKPITPTVNTTWRNLNISFKNQGNKNGYTYHSLYDYFPKNKYGNPPSEVQSTRQLIYDFKDGYNSSEIARLVANAIHNKFLNSSNGWSTSNSVLAIIPASQTHKNHKRFYSFCQDVSNYLQIPNGYNCIEIQHDRNALKGVTGVDKTSNLKYNSSIFSGKKVWLFDDVKTSGGSFYQNAQKLKEHGATEVVGIFLGETYDSFRRGDPNWLNQRQSSPTNFYTPGDDLPF